MTAKILLIDDSPSIHKLVKVRLGKEQVEIHSCYDGAASVAAALEIHPDLILLDVELPGRDGFAICADLKSNVETMNVPIIFLTGAASTTDKIRGLELGATDYITKPFDPAELTARVRASLRAIYLIELLAEKAMIDGLTGLWNRAYLDKRISSELSGAARSARSLSCIMADVDEFKGINDTYGHGFGDQVLRSIGATFTRACRNEDIVCRYGGEEFTILLPGTTSAQAVDLAERLRVVVEAMTTPFRETHVAVTCSFGVASWNGHATSSIVELADRALYRAKSSGRNRVEFWQEEGIPAQVGTP